MKIHKAFKSNEIKKNLNLTNILLLLILLLGIFLRTYNLDELMQFIGDQGWFYISARDMVINHTVPLVGIESSHPWLHQGALWTYILAAIFWLVNFNPVTPAYFTALLDILTILIIYKVTSNMFSSKTGLIASFLYATSPIIIMQSRLAYHTSLIPLFTLLFIYSLYKWTKGNRIYFPIIFFLLAILYNLEIATAVLWVIFFLILIYGIWKRKKWATKILNIKTISISALSWAIPMLPMLIYDTQHGFPQTLKFIAWLGYKILRFFGYPSINPEIADESYYSIFVFLGDKIQNLIFSPDIILSMSLFIFSLLTLAYLSKKSLQENKINNFVIIFLSVLISLVGLIFSKTASDAYFPMCYPSIIISISVFLGIIMFDKKMTVIVILIILTMGAINSFNLIKNNYSTTHKFPQKIDVAKKIISQADGKPYNIKGYPNLSASYGYLTWWLGTEQSEKQENLEFIIKENPDKIEVIKKIKK